MALHFEVADQKLSAKPLQHLIVLKENAADCRRRVKGKCDFNLELWNFQVLAISGIGNSAARVAAQADFVILSLHGKAGLPAEIREWIETLRG